MIRYVFTFFFLYFSLNFGFGCSYFESKDEQPGPSFDSAFRKGLGYLALIEDPEARIDRCDRLTFIGAWQAAVPKKHRIELEGYEYSINEAGEKIAETGQMNRDRKPCFGVDLDENGFDDSRSGISAEGIMGTAHSNLAAGNCELAERVYGYGKAQKWIFGEGPKEYTYLPHLASVLEETAKAACPGAALANMETQLREESGDGWPTIEGYRGNVIAYYIDLYRRIHGKVKSYHYEAIEYLRQEVPENPIYQALYGRFEGNDYGELLALLNDETRFPAGNCPDNEANLFSWGKGAPACILYLYTLSMVNEEWWNLIQ